MPTRQFRVQQVDHIELFVPDQYKAARWYHQILGLEILPAFEHWAGAGPLMISSDGGSTMLALFKGEPSGVRPPVGFRRVAFRVDGAAFLQFLNRLETHPVYTEQGQPTTHLQIIDHDKAWSVYFSDPYGNRFEITTYDYGYVSGHL